MDFVKQARSTQSDVLMSSLNRLRGNEFLCDFTVKVGNKSFPVHRNVLAASSEYFESMFSSNMKEVHDGFIDMKDVDLDGITQCIEFMYKGEADLKIENIQHILKASNLLQMVVLTNLCFQYLQSILSPTNCLSIINLAQMFDRPDVEVRAEGIVVADFESIISSEMLPFINKSDLVRYMKASNAGYQISWNAVLTWTRGEGNEKYLSELVQTIDVKKFPFKFLLETVVVDTLVKANDDVKKTVIVALFSDVKNLKRNLEINNCFILKNLAETHTVSDPIAVKNVINGFLEANFEQIIEKIEFCDVSNDDIVMLLKSPNIKCSSEAVKWHGALKWVKHNVQSRKKIFQELFGLINLEKLPLQFLKETVRSETLVKESRKCYDMLMDELFFRFDREAPSSEEPSTSIGLTVTRADRGASSSNIDQNDPKSESPEDLGAVGRSSSAQGTSTQPGVRIINQQPSNGKMSDAVLYESLPGYEGATLVITYSFPAGSLMGVSYEAQKFTEYLPLTGEGQRCRNLLRQAFNAGSIFKIQVVSTGRGRIIRDDNFPCKTNRTGGPENNGHPDENHVERLTKALEAKGFK